MCNLIKDTQTAIPISVSYPIEVYDKQGRYEGETRVIVKVMGICTSRAIFGTMVSSLPPRARNGYIITIKYMHDTDTSVIEYGFRNGYFKNRVKTSERFRIKMLKQILKEQSK